MTTKKPKPLTVLNAQHPNKLGDAACRFNSEINEQGISPRVMFMPDGHFKSQDGRPFDAPINNWFCE
ncbi:hypothetical protein AN394_02126 [Pseudoalteromonas sp. P1-26]|uniref:hypothetical protein n=1 Tax=Pseudoalteromonas sp. P1-26 TaxID=1723759 RepID=UPI0006D687DD|nr:hypothetical protein [Pseudoalteromonas sp. P1-26]KPZ71200.1 hypothetical protein AN394_02126 [Pseudoalteromonas sp. P1-26]